MNDDYYSSLHASALIDWMNILSSAISVSHKSAAKIIWLSSWTFSKHDTNY